MNSYDPAIFPCIMNSKGRERERARTPLLCFYNDVCPNQMVQTASRKDIYVFIRDGEEV